MRVTYETLREAWESKPWHSGLRPQWTFARVVEPLCFVWTYEQLRHMFERALGRELPVSEFDGKMEELDDWLAHEADRRHAR